jgi:4-hydroxy-4-methyl-2-oxoglutarate aldolase
MPSPTIGHDTMLQLARWNTPTIYNGLEQISRSDLKTLANLEGVRDFMPHMGPMCGRAVTVEFQPGNPEHPRRNPKAWSEYRSWLASIPGPKIVVVQDLDKPRTYGAFWGEVNSSIHRALGCVGTIVDGAIRDLDEMNASGFKALARRLCVGHAFSVPVRWGAPVEVFGTRVETGQLIHADKHGFLVIPQADEPGILEAARFMDANECETLIPAAKGGGDGILAVIDTAAARFSAQAAQRFGRRGEW